MARTPRETLQAVTRLTTKGQTTLPKPVREALGVGPGDRVIWEIGPGGEVRLRRAEPLDLEYLRALEQTLSEWLSPEDEEAYREL